MFITHLSLPSLKETHVPHVIWACILQVLWESQGEYPAWLSGFAHQSPGFAFVGVEKKG